jgi:hypothetical protein
MKIHSAKVIVTRPGRNLVTLKIVTLAAKYPYDPAYLPVARLEDGALTSW